MVILSAHLFDPLLIRLGDLFFGKVIISSGYDNRLILILAVNTLLLIIIPLSVLHWVIPDKICTPIEGKLKKNNTFWNSASLSAFKTWNFKQGWYRGEINKFEHFGMSS